MKCLKQTEEAFRRKYGATQVMTSTVSPVIRIFGMGGGGGGGRLLSNTVCRDWMHVLPHLLCGRCRLAKPTKR